MLNGCRKAEQRREPFIPEKRDGINIFSMASLKDDHLRCGSFKPPLLGSDGAFSRKLAAPGGRVKFFLPAREDVVVQLAVAAVSRILAHLQNSGLIDNTIVIILSDHGEGFAVEQYPYKLAFYYPYDQGRMELYDLAGDSGKKPTSFMPTACPVRLRGIT